MRISYNILFYFIALVFFILSCSTEPDTIPVGNNLLSVVSVQVNGQAVSPERTTYGVPVQGGKLVARIVFSGPINVGSLTSSMLSFGGNISSDYTATKGEDDKTLIITSVNTARYLAPYSLTIYSGNNLGGRVAADYTANFITQIDSMPKFPSISDDQLLDKVQQQTLRYFTDYAHPVSGMARERYGADETVTTGGTGFGIMAILAGIHRGFVSRVDGYMQINKITTFLNQKADKFHGAFPHWINGTTGKTIPFTAQDNGADLVETAFLMQGLLTAGEYFKNGSAEEKSMCDTIQKLWRNVEWTWFQQNGQLKLYWHWSPDYKWAMNMPVSGYNEALIVYVLAAASPTYSIAKEVYQAGWAKNGAIRNAKTFESVMLPLGEDYGGPLFFSHYSFLGLDPRNLVDQYASYWQQNVSHSQINNRYCVRNPNGYYGYSADCWGLTASDYPSGYIASSPTNDVGTIAPTAAISSLPYTPSESLKALRFFYYQLGDKLWGDYGFKDAFCLSQCWFASSYLAIDQGPIVVMIENYRSQLLWKNFMQNSDIRNGLTKLGFTY